MMIILTSLIFYLSNLQYDTKTIMSTMGIFLVSSVRIIPSINKILASLQHIKFSEPACDSLYSDLYLKNFSKDTATEKKLTFKNEIDFEDVSFFHPISILSLFLIMLSICFRKKVITRIRYICYKKKQRVI